MLRLPCLFVAIALSAGWAAEPLGPDTAERWNPQPGWAAVKPEAFSVEARDGLLVFTATGAGTDLPFLLPLRGEELDGDARYLLLRYRAAGLSDARGNYLLHGWEGTPGGRTLALSDELVPDGEWHTLAVDLAALAPREPISQLGLKLNVDEAGRGTLAVERLWFADDLPADAVVARAAAPRSQRAVTLGWDKLAPEPMAGWTATPAADHGVGVDDGVATFRVVGPGGMRWRAPLPEPLDLKGLAWLSTRYRATGDLSAERVYAIWLGNQAAGTGGQSAIALDAGKLVADGEWHRVSVPLALDWTATHVAVGLESHGGAATLELGPLTLHAAEPTYALDDLLAFETRDAPWPAGRDGWTPLAEPATGGRSGALLPQKLGAEDWFESPHLTASGVPFEIVADPAALRQTGTAEHGEIRLPLPPDATEVYLLTAAAAPLAEPFGIDPKRPRPIELMDVPEKVVAEIQYADGPADELLPVDLETGRYGVKRGLAVQALRPAAGRRPTALVLREGMHNASFAILGATVRTDTPRVAEPSWEHLHFSPPPDGPAALLPLAPELDTAAGLTWAHRGGDIAWARSPVFEVVVDGETLPAEAWRLEDDSPAQGRGRRVTLRHESGLRAVVETVPEPGRFGLRMSLTNEGDAARTLTLHFPVLRGVTLGGVDETYYLYGRRGGILNREPARFRDPLGERHPLQCDGFFNPASGTALACLTRDTTAQHHWINLAKSAEGGSWSIEYPRRHLPPGGTFTATEASLHPGAGGWRSIFADYTSWLDEWYTPPADKPWWRRSFATIGRNVQHEAVPAPEQRRAILPTIQRCLDAIGYCDIVHLFGWGSSPRYGEWGDYRDYEGLGGLEAFRDEIAAAQDRGVAVSLYFDAYLLSEKARVAGEHAREWAMRKPDGEPWFVGAYQSFNINPYVPAWQDYLSDVYGKVHEETGARVLYIDEYGATDGRWTDYATEGVPNPGYEIPYRGEAEMMRAIRDEVGPDVALYTEYPPAEVSREVIDGSLTYQAIWSVDDEPLAPHFIDLPRFAFPAFKQLHLIHYVAVRSGNQWPLKFPFFNGETYRLGEPNLPGYDAPSMAFQRRAVQVLCEHRDAFSADDVEPLIPTLVPGVFANRFSAPDETVWTLYNATGRSVRQPVLRVPHKAGATYRNAWTGEALEPVIEGGSALLAVELGPKGVGVVVRRAGA